MQPVGVSSLNVSSSMVASSMTVNSAGLAPIIFVGILIVAVIGLAIIISSMERFAWFMDFIDKAISSVKYTIYGIGLSAVGLFLYVIFNLLQTATRGFDPIWYAYAIIAYIVLTTLGWCGERVVIRVKKLYSEYNEKKKQEVVASDVMVKDAVNP